MNQVDINLEHKSAELCGQLDSQLSNHSLTQLRCLLPGIHTKMSNSMYCRSE